MRRGGRNSQLCFPTWDRCYDYVFKYFRRKIQQKMAFLTENKAELPKILIITLVFEKTPIFSPKFGKKSQKIVIITSTPDHRVKTANQNCPFVTPCLYGDPR
jgi:hypothetical protein